MILSATVSCDPPLGQTTSIPAGVDSVRFVVLLESNVSFSNQKWEVVIWHNGHEKGQWNELKLSAIQPLKGPLSVTTHDRPPALCHYFAGSVDRSKLQLSGLAFTLKFRPTNGVWRWVKEFAGVPDGEIRFQTSKLPASIQDCLPDLSSSFEVEQIPIETPDAVVWELSLAVACATERSSFNAQSLGAPHIATRWISIVRLRSSWITVRHGKLPFDLNEDALVVSFLRSDGLHLVLLAISGIHNTLVVLQGDGEGGVRVNARNDDLGSVKAKVIVGIGYSFESSLAACMNKARHMVTGGFDIDNQLADELEPTDDGQRRLKRLKSPHGSNPAVWRSSWLDGLTYCTWNALGQNLSEKKILDALDDLDRNNIKIANLIIDDNWQSVDNPGAVQRARGWIDFEANQEGFPHGLLHCVTEIRDRHPNIEHVAVWHAMLGYWGALSPTGSIAKKYKTTVVNRVQEGKSPTRKLTVIAAEDVERFYDDFYKFLQGCRIDGVKTDVQHMLDLIDDAEDRRNLIQKYQDAWIVSSLKWFSDRVISCMSQVPQIIFHNQLPQNRPMYCVRNSEDFYPEVPSSHAWHVFSNSNAALFTHHLNAVPDWDMFQTSHEYSSFHAAARCVSGGPVYITDAPGEHDLDLIAQMTAQDNRNNTVILRPSELGRTASSCIYTSNEEERLLKVSSFHGPHDSGAAILGVFNVNQRNLTELIMLSEFAHIKDDQDYVVRAHSTSQISVPMRLNHDLPLVSLLLHVRGWEILTAYPLVRRAGLSIAPIGLLGKMTSVAAIVSSSIETDEKGQVRVDVKLKALGTFGLYISDLEQRSIKDEFLATINGTATPLDTVSTDGNVLRIDLARAWKETGLVPSWNNEVSVMVLIRN